MRTRTGKRTVEVVTARGGQPFRVENLPQIPKGTMNPAGRLVRTIAGARDVMGADYDRLVADRTGRFNGGR